MLCPISTVPQVDKCWSWHSLRCCLAPQSGANTWCSCPAVWPTCCRRIGSDNPNAWPLRYIDMYIYIYTYLPTYIPTHSYVRTCIHIAT